MYYISRNYRSVFDAAGKAKTDFELVLDNLGYKNLGFKRSNIKSSWGTIISFFSISFALIKLPFRSLLITQYPNSKFRSYIISIAKLKKCKIITIVHDVKTLKGQSAKNELSKIETDVIIVHNEAMANWFSSQNISCKVIVLGIFDYLNNKTPTQNNQITEPAPYNIVYAGGLAHKKNSFLYKIDQENNNKKEFAIKLYGKGFDSDKVTVKNSILDYLGMFPSNEIAHKIEGHFGLVWDGESIEECSGPLGNYLKFNNPHKTSLYLSAGLPVLIWKEAALSSFIEKNNLGIAISSVGELNSTLKRLSTKDYQRIKTSVLAHQEKISSGHYYKKAIEEAVKAIHS